MVNKDHACLSIAKQCELLGINRSTLYYKPTEVSKDDVSLLNEIRDIWSSISSYGYRRITRELKHRGYKVNRKHTQRLMKLMGIQAVFPRPRLSVRNQQHETYPYLLKDLAISEINQVWAVDITYLKVGHGFMYLVALIDVYSRYIVDWELSNSLETGFCVDMLNRALQGVKPAIINSDQGSQFTDERWIKVLKENGIMISMDGKGRCLDNIYIERFWRSLKCEDIYLNDYQSVSELRAGIKKYIDFYNNRRWHQSLGYKTPASVYNQKPVDLWTSPAEQPAPYGTCGQVMDNANALPTTCPHSLASRPQTPQAQ
jgi:putative transposase